MKKRKTKVDPVQLPNGCYFTPLKVTPSNWKTAKKITRDWYIFYRFYDPIHKPEGHFVIVKGMNHLKDADTRREATQILIDNEVNDLKAGKKPVTQIQSAPVSLGNLDENTALLAALQWAFTNCGVCDSTRGDLRTMMNYVPIAINTLNYSNIPIKSVSRRHVRHVLDQCAKIKFRIDPGTGKKFEVSWSNHKFNKYRSNLMILFSELVEIDALDANPCRDIRKRKSVSTPYKLDGSLKVV